MYLHHSEFRRQRKIKLESVGYRCKKCNKITDLVHHKDNTKTNHNQANLQALCDRCHTKEHVGKRKKPNSKYIKLYGMTQRDLSLALHVSLMMVKRYHHQRKLHIYLKNKDLFNG
jgi:hypothetical protein